MAELAIEFRKEIFEELTSFTMFYRTKKSIDFVIAPVSNCPYEDYEKNSLWGGNKYPFNQEALK